MMQSVVVVVIEELEKVDATKASIAKDRFACISVQFSPIWGIVRLTESADVRGRSNTVL